MDQKTKRKSCVSALLAAAVSVAVVSGGASADTDVAGVPRFVADYELERNGTRAARLTRSLSCEDDICEFRSEGRTVGLIDFILRGRIKEWTRFRLVAGGGLEPREYYYRQSARGGNDEFRRLFFSPATGRVSSRGDDQWETTVDGDTFDPLLSQLRLLQAVRGGEKEMAFHVVDEEGVVDVYHFEVMGTESVDTGAGSFEAVRVERVDGSSKRRTVMWFAPELDFMPIIVRHERIGEETITATLTRVREQQAD